MLDVDWEPRPLSPRTALIAMELDPIPNYTLCANVAKGLAETIKKRDQVDKEQKEHIVVLCERIADLENNFDMPPDGFVENLYYDLSIPNGNDSFLRAKWIKLLDGGRVAMFSGSAGPADAPTITGLYATPDTHSPGPVEPMPTWFRNLLTGPTAAYQAAYRSVVHPRHWGIRADMARFRGADDDLARANARLQAIEAEINELQVTRSLAQARLEIAGASTLHANFEAMAMGRHVSFPSGAWKKKTYKTDRGRST